MKADDFMNIATIEKLWRECKTSLDRSYPDMTPEMVTHMKRGVELADATLEKLRGMAAFNGSLDPMNEDVMSEVMAIYSVVSGMSIMITRASANRDRKLYRTAVRKTYRRKRGE